MPPSPDNPQLPARTAFLLLKYFNDDMTASEAVEFLAVSRATPDFETLWRREYALDLLLRVRTSKAELKKIVALLRQEQESGADRNETFSLLPAIDWDLLSRMEAESVAIHREQTVEATRKSRPTRNPVPYRKEKTSLWKVAALCLAVLLPAAGLIYHEFRPVAPGPVEPAFQPIGRVTAVAEPVFSDDASRFKPGRAVQCEEIALESGSVELELDNGIRLVLEGPAELRLDSAMSTFCRLGRLSAFVPPEGKGFEVVTPRMTVRDLGTEFVVDVTQRQAEVHVVTGKVEASWLTKDWFEFPAHRGVRVAGEGKIEQIASDIARFMTRKKMNEKAASYESRQSERRREAAAREAVDPALRYRFAAAGAQNIPGTKTTGGLSVPGSLPGAEALLIRHKNDRIDADIPGRFDSMTLVAVVRPDRLDGSNTLLGCNEFYDRPGAFLWQLDRSGRLKFHLQHSQNGRLAIDYYDSPPVLAKRDCGVWTTLAAVVDATAATVTHYLDGRVVAALPYRNKTPLRIGPARLGGAVSGGGGAIRKKTDNYWNGAIESLAIFDRPLSGAEINEFTIY